MNFVNITTVWHIKTWYSSKTFTNFSCLVFLGQIVLIPLYPKCVLIPSNPDVSILFVNNILKILEQFDT